MKHCFNIIILIGLLTVAKAQTMHLKVLNSFDSSAIKGVLVKSHHTHDVLTFSDSSGNFKFHVTETDTILLEKNYYYPMYISLSSHDLDSTHTLIVYLTPSPTIVKAKPMNQMKLDNKNYTFIDQNDVTKDTHITIYQPNKAFEANTGNPNFKEFRFTQIQIHK
jgi:hypothetical protein